MRARLLVSLVLCSSILACGDDDAPPADGSIDGAASDGGANDSSASSDGGLDGGDADGGPPCVTAADCDDGLFCNGLEACDPVMGCVASDPPMLDDAIDCTIDECDEATDTILHRPDDATCDDGLFCNGAETCDAATGCTAGTTPTVDDGIDCTTDSCDESTDRVVNAPNDAACDDADDCTTDTCTAGIGCAHPFTCACRTAADCNDGNVCTTDTCNAAGACIYTNNTASCDDGLYCNGTDTCSGGTCVRSGDPCAAGAVCARSCNEAMDSCFASAGTACTDDGNPCTDDRCNGAGTCAHPPNTAPCNDGLYCNGIDVCSAGTCGHAGDPCVGGAVCNDTCNEAMDSCRALMGAACTSDGNVCTDDVCNGSGACAHPANTAPCNDGLYCNGADVCAGGTCTHAGDPCAGGAVCNDTCNEATDSCATPAGTMCTSDGMACTTDACDGTGTCAHTTTPETACDNGIDDDCDGAIDCADPGCATRSCGPGGATCASSMCVCPTGTTESSCTNGTDDDCDGAIDCADTECASSGVCTCSRTRCPSSACGASESCLGGTCGRGGTFGWDRTFGAASADTAFGIARTSAGYYVTGAFYGTVSFGGTARTSAGSADGYLLALGADGSYRWDRQFSSTWYDQITSVAADSAGNVVVVGSLATSSTVDTGIVRKLDASGTELWARSYGTDVTPLDVAVDSAGNVTVVGYFNGSVDFGGGVRTAVSDPDIFILSLTSTGTRRWDRTFDGGGTFDAASTVATDASNDVYVGGVYGSQVSFGGAPTAMRSGGAFVVSFDASGVYRWDMDFGSTQPDAVSAIAVTQFGDVIVGGSFGATVDFGGGARTSAGFVDAAVFALDTSGAYAWDRVWGGSTSDDRVDGVAVDCAGNVYATGMFQGSVDFGGGARTSAGNRDVFVASLTRTGAYRWDQRYGGSGADRGLAIVASGTGRVGIAGTFSSTVTFGTTSRTSAGGTDAYVLDLFD